MVLLPMRVRILEVHGTTHVRIACDFGELLVVSENNRYLAPGVSADLEFDVDEVLELGRNAFVTEDKTYAVENVGSSIHMRGVVERVYDHGLIDLRLDVHLDVDFTMIEAPPGAFSPGQWIRVELQERSVRACLTSERSTSAEARLDAFEERVAGIPSELVSLQGLGEHIPIHPCSDEVELLAKIGAPAERCTEVDCYWRVLGDVHFVQVMTHRHGRREPGLYARSVHHGSWALNFVAVVEAATVSRALFADALAASLNVLRSKQEFGVGLERVD